MAAGEPARHLTIVISCPEVPTADAIIEVHLSPVYGYVACLIADPKSPETHFACNIEVDTETAMAKIAEWIDTSFAEAFEPERTGREE
jgi:hypothetical protein